MDEELDDLELGSRVRVWLAYDNGYRGRIKQHEDFWPDLVMQASPIGSYICGYYHVLLVDFGT